MMGKAKRPAAANGWRSHDGTETNQGKDNTVRMTAQQLAQQLADLAVAAKRLEDTAKALRITALNLAIAARSGLEPPMSPRLGAIEALAAAIATQSSDLQQAWASTAYLPPTTAGVPACGRTS